MIARLRYIVRLTVAFVLRFKTLLLLGVLLGFSIFFVVRFLLPAFLGIFTQKIGITGRVTTANIPPFILHKISHGLTSLSPSGDVMPDIASSWETSDKGKTWTFHLKKGLSWQDGKPLTSGGINYAFSDVKISRPDPLTIVFTLQSPYSAFPAVVSRPVFKSGLLGTGDWQVKNLSLAGSYVDEIVIENASKERLDYRFYPTEERAKIAFELGQVSELQGIFDSKPLDSWKKIKITKITNTGEYVGIFFNTANSPFSDKSLRQALAYAVDKDRFSQTRAISPISIDSWAFNPQVKPYAFDAKKAKSLIDDYKKTSKIDKLTVTLTTPPILLSQAESIINDWKSVGVEVDLKVAGNVPSEYQALLAIFDIPDDPDQYSIWHSTQTATNITRYNNPRIDKLLEDGRTEIDIQARKQTYFDFQRYLVEDSPAIFLYYPTTYTISRK